VADAIALFLEEGAEAIAFFGSVAFLQAGIAEHAREVMIGLDQRLIAFEISREIFVSSFLRIEIEMRVGMIADEVPGFVPLAEEFLALRRVDSHAAYEKGDLEAPFIERIENSAIGFAPGDVWTDGGGGVVHRDGDAGPFGRGRGERW